MRLPTRMSLLVMLAMLVVPVAAADAREFKGQTSQRGGVLLSTNSNGLPSRINIGWRAFCAGGRGSVPSSTLISSPFDRGGSRRIFYNSGSYSYRGRRGARNYVKTRVKGRRKSARSWRGQFRVRIVIKRKGRTLYRCRSGLMRWRARR